MIKLYLTEGGEGSGNFGHGGRPGQVGGSSKGHSAYTYPDTMDDSDIAYHLKLLNKIEYLRTEGTSEQYIDTLKRFDRFMYWHDGIELKPGFEDPTKKGYVGKPVRTETKPTTSKLHNDDIGFKDNLRLIGNLKEIHKGPTYKQGMVSIPSPFYDKKVYAYVKSNNFRYTTGKWTKRIDPKEMDKIQTDWARIWDIRPNENFKGWVKRTRVNLYELYKDYQVPERGSIWEDS